MTETKRTGCPQSPDGNHCDHDLQVVQPMSMVVQDLVGLVVDVTQICCHCCGKWSTKRELGQVPAGHGKYFPMSIPPGVRASSRDVVAWLRERSGKVNPDHTPAIALLQAAAALEGREDASLPCGHPPAALGRGPDDVERCLWCGDLHDLQMLIDHLSRTYDHFSGGVISKPNTEPEEVFRLADDLAMRDRVVVGWLCEGDPAHFRPVQHGSPGEQCGTHKAGWIEVTADRLDLKYQAPTCTQDCETSAEAGA